jgi:hypothetical protein
VKVGLAKLTPSLMILESYYRSDCCVYARREVKEGRQNNMVQKR